MLVVYTNCDEVLICTKQNESKLIRDYFVDGGRTLEDYDRDEYEGGICDVTYRALVR